ncbi:MFS transporter [Variovorax sp. dw_954]|uniref:MFS transporter n=1 Tax=Variovorax sp. dw_954 TaxID=2720078 RepID=UPI001BD5B369|nr:MFS transporter [Variovorax sp. dw_954]
MEHDVSNLNAGHSGVAPSEIAVGVIVGRASEYFDYFVYGIASVLVFPGVFFPFEEPLEGTLYSFVVFALAFIARPIGTIVFFDIQRRWGRGVKLTAALFMLGFATAGIAFLPGYESVGPWSIVLLSILRCFQGFGLGGSWDGLPSLLALNAPPKRHGWYAMIPQLGAPIGFVIAAGLFLYLYSELTSADFMEWGWRYPFYVAFTINVVALFARLRIVVTDDYERLLDKYQLHPVENVSELLDTSGGSIVIGAFAALASYALFHLVTVFPLSWLIVHSSQAIDDILIVQICGGVLAFFGVMASGWIADRIGRRNTLGTMAVLIGIFAALSPLMLGGQIIHQNIFILVGFALLGLSYGQSAGAATGNLEPKYRYTGAALTSDMAWLIGAAFAPLVAIGLSSRFGLVALSGYLLSGVIGTLLALRINRSLNKD